MFTIGVQNEEIYLAAENDAELEEWIMVLEVETSGNPEPPSCKHLYWCFYYIRFWCEMLNKQVRCMLGVAWKQSKRRDGGGVSNSLSKLKFDLEYHFMLSLLCAVIITELAKLDLQILPPYF